MQYILIHDMTAFKLPNVRYMYIRETYSRIHNEKITKTENNKHEQKDNK